MATVAAVAPNTIDPQIRHTAQFAWITLVYNVAVIVWGAYVRATGAGAGCGNHWPLCNGQIIPRAPRLETIVEYSHRTTSGLAAILVLALLIACWRLLPKGHPARIASLVAALLMLTEALIGAALVKLQLVAQDQSIARAISLPIHSTNTMLLLAAIAITALWLSLDAGSLRRSWHEVWLALPALIMILTTSAVGVIAALGDTLFPTATMAEDFSRHSHFLVRLRVLHPALAVATAVLIVMEVVRVSRKNSGTFRLAGLVVGAIASQLILGVLNIWLLAPVWLQLAHLAVADAVWIGMVLIAAGSVFSPLVTDTAGATAAAK